MPGKKRGQTTLFIILGIFILVAAGTAFYYKGEFLKDRLQELERLRKAYEYY